MKSSRRFDHIFLLDELCLVALYANAWVEHFINHMKIAEGLENLHGIQVKGPDLA